jgi:flagellar basal body-associated protein FliL
MPEEAQEEVAVVTGSGGPRIAPLVIGGVVALLVVVVVVLVMVMAKGKKPSMISQEQRQKHDSVWLDIPVLEVKDIPLSVPLVASGAQRKPLTVGVVIRFAPPEGEKADVKKLQKEFIPRVQTLQAEFRHIVIQQMNSKDYANLSNAEQRNQLLKNFRNGFQEKLRQYGLDKMARVHDVLWGDFFWN